MPISAHLNGSVEEQKADEPIQTELPIEAQAFFTDERDLQQWFDTQMRFSSATSES